MHTLFIYKESVNKATQNYKKVNLLPRQNPTNLTRGGSMEQYSAAATTEK